MKKALFFIAFLLLIIPNILFASGLFESSEDCNLLFLPRTVANNSNVMIELSQAKNITTSTTTADFANSDDNHQAMFRLRDTLENVSNNNNLVLEITSDNGWNFVNESNAMETRPFSIGIICFDRQRSGSSYTSYSSQVLTTGSSHKLVNNSYVAADPWTRTTTLTKSNASITVSFDGTKYTVTIPTTSRSNKKPEYMREIDFCIVLDENAENLEAGYYSTVLHVSTNKAHTTTNGSAGPFNEDISIRGYIGTDPGENNATYNFQVSSAIDTYSMDLEISNHNTIKAYDVASVSFLYSEIVTSEPNENSAKNRFTIYISPTPVYTASGQYKFIKLDTDNQARTDKNTVYYDLYIRTGANTYTAMNSTTSSNSKYEGKIGSWGKDSTVTTTYYMRPTYSSAQISSSALFGGGENKYQLTWELNQEIWLKINDSTHDRTYNSLGKLHSPGMFWSYIYLTLVTTT